MKAYTRISDAQRDRIGLLLAQGKSTTAIATRLRRYPSIIRRERERSRPYYLGYSTRRAGIDAKTKRKRSRRKRKLVYRKLWCVVRTKLKLRRSPEQIARFLKKTYPQETHMYASHEIIYTYIYIPPRGRLRTEIICTLSPRSMGHSQTISRSVAR